MNISRDFHQYILAATLGDLLLRGMWRFIHMTPGERDQSTSSIKTLFMIFFPLGYISTFALFILPDNLSYLQVPCAFISALSVLCSVSMFTDALKYIHRLENQIKQLASKDTNKQSDKNIVH